MRGVITKWRGSYGFIRYGGQDVFVHTKNFLGGSTPELNSLVEFQFGPPTREDKPFQAVNVRVVQLAAEVLAGIAQKVQQQGGGR